MNEQKPNCHDCRHFHVTWDSRFPNGCKMFGIKTNRVPSLVIREATGTECANYEQRAKPNRLGG